MIARVPFSVVCLMAAGLICGCSPYVDGLRYSPQPAVVEVRPATTQPAGGMPPQQTVPLTVYTTIIGVRHEDEKQHLPLSVEVRLRFDNQGPQDVFFDPRTLELLDGRLNRFPPPIFSPMQPVSLAPGQPYVVQANFPFPPGVSYDNPGMETLQLNWGVRIGNQPVAQHATFRRVRYYYYDVDPDYGPYWWGYPPYPGPYPYPGFGGSVIIVH